MRRSEQIPYGVKDFKQIRLENLYYVDKTAFIRKMEERARFLFFVRPRRFGKSLLCETLRCYYDVAEKENCEKLFGDLDIGKNPTKNANRYFVLSLDFSQVSSGDGATWSAAFRDYIDQQLDDLTSGFNIATNISLEADFHAMVGFTTAETRRLFEDFQGVGRFTGDVAPHLRTVKAWYDSYCFSEKCVGTESLYNCDMALYYLSSLVATGRPPRDLIDGNIRSDWSKLHLILDAQRHAETVDEVLPPTEELADTDETTFKFVPSFPIEKIFDEANFKSL